MVQSQSGASAEGAAVNSGKPLTRALSTIEHLLHHWNEAYGGACTAAAVARVQGILDRSRLETDLRDLQQRDPLLNVVITGSSHSPRFERKMAPVPIPVTWVDETDSLAWKRRLVELAATSFDATTGPLIRVEILENREAGFADILVHAHHSICDGQSMLKLYHCLLGETASGADQFNDRDWLTTPVTVRKHSRWKSWAGIWSIIRRRRQARRRGVGCLPGQPHESVTVCRRSLSAELTSQLVRDCRQESTTVYGALAAAIQLALAGHFQLWERPLPVQSLINTRDWYRPVPASGQFGCYVGTVMSWLVLQESSRFWDVARECREQVTNYLQQNGPDWSSRLLAGALRRKIKLNREPALCVINSVGVVPKIAGQGDIRLTDLGWISNLDETGIPLGFVALSVGGQLQITAQSRWLSPPELETLLARIEDLLSTPASARSTD